MEIENSPGSQLKPVVELQEVQEKAGRKKGGWVTLPFIAGAYI
jgi:peptide/histidine transporter 3/4